MAGHKEREEIKEKPGEGKNCRRVKVTSNKVLAKAVCPICGTFIIDGTRVHTQRVCKNCGNRIGIDIEDSEVYTRVINRDGLVLVDPERDMEVETPPGKLLNQEPKSEPKPVRVSRHPKSDESYEEGETDAAAG